jgi:hypothetical protein
MNILTLCSDVVLLHSSLSGLCFGERHCFICTDFHIRHFGMSDSLTKHEDTGSLIVLSYQRYPDEVAEDIIVLEMIQLIHKVLSSIPLIYYIKNHPQSRAVVHV